MEQKSIFRYTIEELENFLLENGFKKFSAKQIYDWIYIKMETNFDNMTNLSKELREFIKKRFTSNLLKDLVTEESKDGTIKILFMLDDKKLLKQF